MLAWRNSTITGPGATTSLLVLEAQAEHPFHRANDEPNPPGLQVVGPLCGLAGRWLPDGSATSHWNPLTKMTTICPVEYTQPMASSRVAIHGFLVSSPRTRSTPTVRTTRTGKRIVKPTNRAAVRGIVTRRRAKASDLMSGS